MHTELGRIAALLQRGATVHSPLEKQVQRATRVIAAASLVIGAAFVPAGLPWQTVESGSRARPLRPRGSSVIDRGLLTRAWLLLGGVSAVLFIGGVLLTLLRAGWHLGDPTRSSAALHHAYQQARAMTPASSPVRSGPRSPPALNVPLCSQLGCGAIRFCWGASSSSSSSLRRSSTPLAA